jgi:hypothetical protein
MCYGLPGAIMKDGEPVPGGARINAQDGAFAAAIYPPAAAPAPPPGGGITITVPKAGTYRYVP